VTAVCTVRLPASPDGIAALVERLTAFTGARGLSTAVTYRLRLAAEELVANVLEHGRPADPGAGITVVLRDHPDRVELSVIDTTGPFNPAEITGELSPKAGAEGGFGLFLLRNMVDRIDYCRQAGCNETTVIVAKEPA
jgi:serine/threonine-protein kinase RsbW